MKIKNKGKVYPSPSSSLSSSSSSSSSSSPSVAFNGEKDTGFLSILTLLPAAILALASVLSLEDREVLAYMITRSLKTTTTTTSTTTTSIKKPSSLVQESKKKSSKRPPNNRNQNSINNNTVSGGNHKAPVFDCDCFDCYTSYWFRWDSSPNRELIHQAIEAFEDHLTNGEQPRRSTRGKRRDRMGKKPVPDVLGQPEMAAVETAVEKSQSFVLVSPDDDVSTAPGTPDKAADRVEEEVKREGVMKAGEKEVVTSTAETAVVEVALSNHKGLARKVLPDVLGLLNSRLWSLWSPNV